MYLIPDKLPPEDKKNFKDNNDSEDKVRKAARRELDRRRLAQKRTGRQDDEASEIEFVKDIPHANQVLRKIAEAPDPNLKVEGQTCKCIERLDIIGHGVHNFHEAQIVNDNGIEKIINPMTRDGWIGPRRGFTASMPHRRDTVLSEETAKNLFNHVSFCTPCVIRLWHCHIGKNMSLLREITVLTGCTTVANTGESIPKDWTNIEPKVNRALDVFYQGSAEMGKK